MAASTTPITGDTGRIKLDATSLVQFFSWSVNPKAEVKTTRAYDDVQGWERSTEATLKMWDGTCEGNFVRSQYDALLADLGRKLPAVFVTETDEVDPDATGPATGTEYGYAGDIIIVSLPIKHQVGEIVTCSLEFKGTGPFAPYSGPNATV
jgi:hypothetical protein